MRKLAQTWSKDPHFSSLNLSAHNIGAGAAETLATVLRERPSITSVDCSLNPDLKDEGARLLVPLVRSDGTGISTIRALSLKRCGIGDAGEESSIFHKYINMALWLRCNFRWKRCGWALCSRVPVFYKNTDSWCFMVRNTGKFIRRIESMNCGLDY